MSNESTVLLIGVVKVLREIAGLLQSKETERNLIRFYVHLIGLCLVVETVASDYVDRASTPAHRLLDRLQLLVATPIRQDSSLQDSTSRSCLSDVIDRWNQVADKSDSDKLGFIRMYLDFGPSAGQREELLSSLRTWVDEVSAVSQNYVSAPVADTFLPQLTTNDGPSYAIWAAAQQVYETLVASKNCTCEPSRKHYVRLCLRTYRESNIRENSDIDDEIDFNIFFNSQQSWREARIHHAKKEPAVRFQINDAATESRETARKKRKQIKKLCKEIERSRIRPPLHLELVVENGLLYKLQSMENSYKIDVSKSPTSLEWFITKHPESLTDKTKRVLAVLLSCAVFHLYGTSWLQSEWSSSKIIFFHTESSEVPLRPFLNACLVQTSEEKMKSTNSRATDDGGDDSDSDEGDPDDLLLRHPFPGIVNLAIILLELHFVVPFNILAEKYNISLPEDSNYTLDFLDVCQVYRECESDIPDYSGFVTAISSCLDQNIWQDEECRPLDVQHLRDTIYKEIVQPLENELRSSFPHISLERLDVEAQQFDLAKFGRPIPIETSVVSSPRHHHRRMMNIFEGFAPRSLPQRVANSRHMNRSRYSRSYGGNHSTKLFDDNLQGISQEAEERYFAWLENYQTVFDQTVSGCSPGGQCTPIKIAVLDTGLDLLHPDIRACENQVKGIHNWIDSGDPQQIIDSNGHGTCVAGLLLDFAPGADLFVAKIAEKKPLDPRMIAAAIDYAVREWKVDMISMSFGFPTRDTEHYQVLEKAIRNAHHAQILLFAAASNGGANHDRAYPARHDEVICIHSTDALGNRSTFSPTAKGNDDNFATIGEAIECAWPTNLPRPNSAAKSTVSKSGTSFATPVAVGIAAFLLEYTRLHLGEELAKMLKRNSAMKAVLRIIAHDRRNGYDYIAISNHPDSYFGRDKDLIKQEIRHAIQQS